MSILYFVIIFYSNKLFIEIASLLVEKKTFSKASWNKKVLSGKTHIFITNLQLRGLHPARGRVLLRPVHAVRRPARQPGNVTGHLHRHLAERRLLSDGRLRLDSGVVWVADSRKSICFFFKKGHLNFV